jgi:hypothetical protein
MEIDLHPYVFIYKHVSRNFSCAKPAKNKTDTLNMNYCPGCQTHYVDQLARSPVVSPIGIFVSSSGSLSMHQTCFRVLHLSDGQTREKSVWYFLTAKRSSSFIPTDEGCSFPCFINDIFQV